LGRYHGEPVFKGLITATNHVGEIRKQFHVVTDGHDQIEHPIKDMLTTMEAYGHPMPQLLTTDKPFEDKAFYYSIIPSLRKKKSELESAAQSNDPTAPSPMTECDFSLYAANVKICKTAIVTSKQSALQSES
jgi:hypothetical protein